MGSNQKPPSELLVQETCFPMLLHQVIQKEDRGLIVKNDGLDAVNGTVNGARRYSKKGVLWIGKRVSLCCTAAPIANVFKTTFWILTFVGADGEPPIHSLYSAPESLKSRGYPSGQGWLSPLMLLGVAPSQPIVTLN